MTAELISQMEMLIRRDPGRRGLIGDDSQAVPLCLGELAGAAAHLAAYGTSVAIVTGFYIPGGTPPSAETDGPPGSLFLAEALRRTGMETWVITDNSCRAALLATARATGFPEEHVLTAPLLSTAAAVANACPFEAWERSFWEQTGANLSHLIALERVGPSHTLESWLAQPGNEAVTAASFCELVPEEDRNACHNMRGEKIDGWTAPLHRLFDAFPYHRPGGRIIGIGDGGNEIGMGKIPWSILSQRLTGPQRYRLPCRIAADWAILAGTSNWGGYALAAATLLLRGDQELLRECTQQHELAVLERLVSEGPAVDGVTRQQQATVDGLPFLTYIQPWMGIRRLLGWEGAV